MHRHEHSLKPWQGVQRHQSTGDLHASPGYVHDHRTSGDSDPNALQQQRMQSWAAHSQSIRRCESDANVLKKRKHKGSKGEDRGQAWLGSGGHFHPTAPAPWTGEHLRASRPPRSHQAQPPPKLRIPRGRGSSSSSTMLCESAQSSCCTPDDNNGISPLEVGD